MYRILTVVVLTLLTLAPASRASAQLIAAKDGPIVYGHHHLNVTSIAEHKKFWADTLGGAVVTIGTNNVEIVRFSNALIFMRVQAPTGPTKGSTFDHMGFSVPNLRAVIDKVKAAGYQMVSTQEAPAGVKVVDDIGVVDAGGTTGIAYALGPDGVKIELLERKAQTAPIASHHLHFFGDKQSEMHAWYIKVFGAVARSAPGNGFIGADLPGVGLNFSPSATPRAGTKGRALDHIGFEVKNLEAFCKALEAQGITLEVPYRRVPALNIAIAFISDPWGTYIELTEGLDKVP